MQAKELVKEIIEKNDISIENMQVLVKLAKEDPSQAEAVKNYMNLKLAKHILNPPVTEYMWKNISIPEFPLAWILAAFELVKNMRFRISPSTFRTILHYQKQNGGVKICNASTTSVTQLGFKEITEYFTLLLQERDHYQIYLFFHELNPPPSQWQKIRSFFHSLPASEQDYIVKAAALELIYKPYLLSTYMFEKLISKQELVTSRNTAIMLYILNNSYPLHLLKLWMSQNHPLPGFAFDLSQTDKNIIRYLFRKKQIKNLLHVIENFKWRKSFYSSLFENMYVFNTPKIIKKLLHWIKQDAITRIMLSQRQKIPQHVIPYLAPEELFILVKTVEPLGANKDTLFMLKQKLAAYIIGYPDIIEKIKAIEKLS